MPCVMHMRRQRVAEQPPPERSRAGMSKTGRRKRLAARWRLEFGAIIAVRAGICALIGLLPRRESTANSCSAAAWRMASLRPWPMWAERGWLARRSPCTWAILLAALLPAAPAAAADAWELIHPKMFDWRQAEQRRAVARDLVRRLDLLAAVVPEQSPKELGELVRKMAELQGMAAGESSERRSRLYISRQYQHFRLLELIGEVRASLDCILAAGRLAQDQRLAQEMHCWSLASLHFGDETTLSLALPMLRNARLIPKERNMPVMAKGPALWYAEYGRGILRHILAPYLACAAAQLLAEAADACPPAPRAAPFDAVSAADPAPPAALGDGEPPP